MTNWLLSFFSWLKLVWQRLTGGPLLVVERPAGIGDVLCALPAAAALRAQHPNARLVFVTSRALVPLVELSGIADCVVACETRGLARLRRWLRPVRDIYALLPDEQTPPRPRGRIHLNEEFARVLGVQGQKLCAIRLTPTSNDIATVKAMLAASGITNQPFIVFHAGPTWAVKQWTAESWAALAERLKQETGMQIIQTGADTYAGLQGVRSPHIQGTLDWTARLALTETLALMRLAKLFVGVDSGMLHLACAAGTPAVGLFGPTDPACFLPSRSNIRGVKTTLDCIGCHHHPEGPRHWRTGCPRDIRCMMDLSVDTVYQQSLALLA